MPISFGKSKYSVLDTKLGVELRSYFENGNYIYISPALIRELYKDKSDLEAKFVGVNEALLTPNIKERKHAYGLINIGAEIKLNDSFSTNINLGSKFRSNEKYYTGTIGVRYTF